jgi:hypothetical protein
MEKIHTLNQKYIQILSHPSQNGYNQENKQQQMLVRMCVEKELLYTIGGNIN